MNMSKQFLYGLVLLFGVSGCGEDISGIHSVADIESAKPGEEAELSGVVIAESGIYDSFLTKGFTISEESGGLYIVTDDVQSVNRGDAVTVSGKIEDLFGMKVLRAKSIVVSPNKKGYESKITPLTPNQFDEYYVGKLASIEAQIVALNPDLPYGWKLKMTDANGGMVQVEAVITSTSDIDPRGDARYKKGANVKVTGFMITFKNNIYILPRDQRDIEFIQEK